MGDIVIVVDGYVKILGSMYVNFNYVFSILQLIILWI